MTAIYAIYGASGFGREVMPIAKQTLIKAGVSSDCLYFIDDDKKETNVNGIVVLTLDEFLKLPAEKYHINIAIANSAVREQLQNTFNKDNIIEWTLIADNVVSFDDVSLGDGSTLCPFVTLTSNIKIGRGFQANIYSYVAHDCVIGDFVTFAPGVKCNGNVHIDDHAYIGTGAIIKQGRNDKPLRIGKGAVIGMGAVVTKDVAPGITVIGNPARPMTKEGLRK